MNTAITTRSKSNTAVIATTFLALGYAMSGGSANAETSQPVTKRVAYGDLNLDSQAGAKVFYARIRSAAESVCSPLEGRELALQRIWHACIDDALATAVAQVDKPNVTALHNQDVSGTKG
jgi:UrcA family protein